MYNYRIQLYTTKKLIDVNFLINIKNHHKNYKGPKKQIPHSVPKTCLSKRRLI